MRTYATNRLDVCITLTAVWIGVSVCGWEARREVSAYTTGWTRAKRSHLYKLSFLKQLGGVGVENVHGKRVNKNVYLRQHSTTSI